MTRTIFHIDVNSAFLSWSAADKLSKGEELDIREVPSIIGGSSDTRHGVVLAKSIPAKKYGVVTGESIFTALKKCPGLLIVKPDMKLYSSCSEKMMELLYSYSPDMERYSIYEAFLDVTGMYKDPIKTAEAIREKIKNDLGFTVSVGVSENKLLAKMASELRKPDKVNTLFRSEMKEKLWPLPVNELFMVGKKAAEKLNKMYIFTIGDLAKADMNHIKGQLKSYGEMIWNYANGIDDSKVVAEESELKIISNSTTFSPDITRRDEAIKVIVALCENVAARLRKTGKFCTSVSVSVRDSGFKNYSHQKKLPSPTASTQIILEASKQLFDEVWKKEPIRLIGIHLGGLTKDEFEQLTLFPVQKPSEKDKALDKAIDSIRQKFGNEAVLRSIMIEKGKD